MENIQRKEEKIEKEQKSRIKMGDLQFKEAFKEAVHNKKGVKNPLPDANKEEVANEVNKTIGIDLKEEIRIRKKFEGFEDKKLKELLKNQKKSEIKTGLTDEEVMVIEKIIKERKLPQHKLDIDFKKELENKDIINGDWILPVKISKDLQREDTQAGLLYLYGTNMPDNKGVFTVVKFPEHYQEEDIKRISKKYNNGIPVAFIKKGLDKKGNLIFLTYLDVLRLCQEKGELSQTKVDEIRNEYLRITQGKMDSAEAIKIIDDFMLFSSGGLVEKLLNK